jgi:hypothetical protein
MLRKLTVYAVATLLVCEVVLVAGCRANTEPQAPGTVPARPTSQRPRPDRDRTPSSTTDIDLAELLTDVPEYEGSGRNLFAFGPERTVSAAPPPRQAPSAATTVGPATASPGRQASAPARIDLTFAGFVEKTEPGGANKKYAVFLDGEEILTGAEGDLVGNRYKIVEIGLESVTVSLAGSQVTQKIPLRTN